MKRIFLLSAFVFSSVFAHSQGKKSGIKIIAFYTGRADLAHISFVNETKTRLPEILKKTNISVEFSNDWNKMNSINLQQYKLVLLLDTRPEQTEQRDAFQSYLKKGGAAVIFHFAGFALTPSDFPQNWNWYHDTLIGSGQYKGNTWRPTSAILKNEKPGHPALKKIPPVFTSTRNEWYSWEKDIRLNDDIEILLSIDSTSFPLGTGPKQHEIWHNGYYPVAWTNKKYKMVYINMGHNDMDYDGGTNATLSSQYASEMQNRFLVNIIKWLADGK